MAFVVKPLHPLIRQISTVCLSRKIAFDFWGTPEASPIQTSMVLRSKTGKSVHVFVQDKHSDTASCRVPNVLAGRFDDEVIRAWWFEEETDGERIRFLFNDVAILMEKIGYGENDESLEVIDLTD